MRSKVTAGTSIPEQQDNESAELEEREFRIWLRSVEKRAILPLKWAIFATSLLFWLLSHLPLAPPPVEVFALFTIFFMFNAGETYLLLVSRVSLPQTRVLCIVSYYVDVLFVTLLVYFDARRFPAVEGASTDFYIFYFLLILRGFALFRTARANLTANILIGAVFVLTLVWQDEELISFSSLNSLIRIVFIWLVISMSWFIVEVINRQKEEILRAREKLVQSENMALLGELAAGVAHEINNPIGIISAYAEFLSRNAPEGDPRLEDFQIIHKEARRCENIVSELLDYARPAGRGIMATDLQAINDEVLDFISRRPREGAAPITVKRVYPVTVPTLMADPNQLKQALLNIYLNAQQAMPEGGEIRVEISKDHDRNRLHLRVHDTGAGIDARNMKRVFDPFFTTRHKGTGLGLAITRRIVESYGGEIQLTSTPGKGTIVDVFFELDRMAD